METALGNLGFHDAREFEIFFEFLFFKLLGVADPGASPGSN